MDNWCSEEINSFCFNVFQLKLRLSQIINTILELKETIIITEKHIRIRKLKKFLKIFLKSMFPESKNSDIDILYLDLSLVVLHRLVFLLRWGFLRF